MPLISLKRYYRGARFGYLLLLSMVLLGCDAPTKPSGPAFSDTPKASSLPVARFAVHPLHNPQKLVTAYQPLIDLLNQKQTGVRFEVEASRDYASYEAKLGERAPEFALPNPWQTTQAIKNGYRVIAMAGSASDFKGIFLVRKDSDIKKLSDLVGKSISYPAPTALAASMMPQLYLQNHGINVVTETKSKYVGSQESSIMNVYLKDTAVGVTWPPPWRAFQKEHPAEAAQLMVAWETEALINNAVIARDDMPAPLVDIVKHTLFSLHKTPEGQRILAGMETDQFLPATNADYKVVDNFMNEFERKVRKPQEFK